ncbi:hypothetical protein MKW98_032139 [Papaver atlanticum]|uniref:MADS-box domain-containing protein n=1 Tax=Papaver atlanticum TaxID=357466 RepID=A0AAD4SFV5_9MAGN|nr:hypothetical protein MKW98_032139 [Papaver atlanticum]
MASTRKTSTGKKKIEIKRIMNENARQIAFSKRKAGVFKKAHELGTLCGAQVAVIVNSPAGIPYSYINSETVIDHYLSGDNRTPTPPVMPHREARILELNKEYSEALERNKSKYWWDPIDDLGVKELEILCGAIEALKLKVAERAGELQLSSTSFLPRNNFGMSTSSSTAIQNYQTLNFSLPYHGYGSGFGLNGTGSNGL